MIKVLVGDRANLSREGICAVVRDTPDPELAGVADDYKSLLEIAAKCVANVIILDVGLPGLNQEDLIKDLRNICPTGSVLLIADRRSVFSLTPYIKAGAIGYITRSVSGERLAHAIRSANNGEAVLDATVIRYVANILESGGSFRRTSGKLNLREIKVLELVARGLSNKAIAGQLCVSSRTVDSELRTIFRKMAVSSRTEAFRQALVQGWISLEQ